MVHGEPRDGVTQTGGAILGKGPKPDPIKSRQAAIGTYPEKSILRLLNGSYEVLRQSLFGCPCLKDFLPQFNRLGALWFQSNNSAAREDRKKFRKSERTHRKPTEPASLAIHFGQSLAPRLRDEIPFTLQRQFTRSNDERFAGRHGTGSISGRDLESGMA